MDRSEKESLLGKVSEGISKTYIAVIAITYLLYNIGLVLFVYVINEWVQYVEQSRVFPNGSFNSTSSGCDTVNQSRRDNDLYERVEAETAKWQMFLNLGLYIPCVLSTAIIPAYSDTFGRKFLLILGCSGTLVRIGISTFAVYYNLHPIYVVMATVLEGCTGGMFSLSYGMSSYMADLTDSGRQRSLWLTVLDGQVLVGVTLGGLGSGYYVQYLGHFLPVVTAGGLVLCALVSFVFIVPESFPKRLRSKTRSVFAVLKGTFSFYFSDSFKERRVAYLLLLSVYVLLNFTSGPRAMLELLYQLGRPFCWSTDKIGIFSALRHFAQGFVALVLVKPLQHCISDLNIAILSTVFACGSFVLEALAKTNLELYLVPALAMFAYLCYSMTKSFMSKITPPDRQGSLFSSLAVTEVSCSVVASFLLNTIYASTTSFMSGFIFLLQAGICLMAMIILIIYSRTQQVHHVHTETIGEYRVDREGDTERIVNNPRMTT